MGGNSMGLIGIETPSASRPGGPTSAAVLLAEGDRPGPIGMNTPAVPAEESSGGGVVDAQKILNYASSNAGKRVGIGQCFDLADKALRGAGAKSAADFGKITKDGDYVWGTPVELANVKPGDIIQFRDYAYDISSTKVSDDGTKQTIDGGGQVRGSPNHTAIVKSVGSNGVITVWEQNIPPGKGSVQTFDLYGQSTTIDRGDGVTDTVTVEGAIKFYRPQPKS